MPPIFGTGAFIGDGLVATNKHVVAMFSKLWKPQNKHPEGWPVLCYYFHEVPGEGMMEIPIEVMGVFVPQKLKVKGYYYGPEIPDIAFVKVKVRGIPSLKVNSSGNDLTEGKEIATAGFPMGTEALMAPGYLHQFTPILQRGIISAVLPFRCSTPHAVMINVMCQGGASGSPVFFPGSPELVGVLYGSLVDRASGQTMPTNFSYRGC